MSEIIQLGIPQDNKLLEALGSLAVADGNLHMNLIMCLKTLNHMKPGEALKKYRRSSASKLRKEIEKHVRELATPNENDQVCRVIETIHDARCHSERRNALIHRFWGRRQNGEWVTSGDENIWEPLPSVHVINDLVQSIMKTAQEINDDRRDESGFLAILAKRSGNKDMK